MNKKLGLRWITGTAIFTALIIVAQAVTAPLGNTFVTGSIVNLLLIVAVMLFGLPTGISVAIVSPIMAKLLGIGPLWSIIPFIALGNIVLVTVWHLIANRKMGQKIVPYIAATVCGAVAKFLTLYLGIVKIAVPLLLKLPEKQAAVISGIFSVPQLITALIGGGIAVLIIPRLKAAVDKK